MNNRFLTAIGYWILSLLMFVATMIVIRWVIAFVSWTRIDSGWAQAIGSILAVIAAFLVADRQFQMSRRESRVVANSDTIRRIKIILDMFTSVVFESTHFHASALGYGANVANLDTSRIIELRDTFKSIPLLDVPTSDLASFIVAMPLQIDRLLQILTLVQASPQSPTANNGTNHLMGSLAHQASTILDVCVRAQESGHKEIEKLDNPKP